MANNRELIEEILATHTTSSHAYRWCYGCNWEPTKEDWANAPSRNVVDALMRGHVSDVLVERLGLQTEETRGKDPAAEPAAAIQEHLALYAPEDD